MGMQLLTLLDGTTLSATGGTTKTFTPTNETVVGGVKLIDAAVTDLRIRPYVIAKTVWPVLTPQGKYVGKVKMTINIVEPIIESDGTISLNSLKIERSTSPTYTAAQLLELEKKGAQLLFDADTAAFRSSGSLA